MYDDRELELDDERERCIDCGAPCYRDESWRTAKGYVCDLCATRRSSAARAIEEARGGWSTWT